MALIKRLGMRCQIRRPSEQALAANARFTSPLSFAAPRYPPPPRPAAPVVPPAASASPPPARPLVEPSPPAPPRLRAQVIALQRRAFELQRGDAGEAPDPLDAGVAAFDVLVLVAAGEYDLPDFGGGSLAASLRAPRELILGVGDLAPLEDPEPFRSLRRLLA